MLQERIWENRGIATGDMINSDLFTIASKGFPWSSSTGETVVGIERETLTASNRRTVGRGFQEAMKCPMVDGGSKGEN